MLDGYKNREKQKQEEILFTNDFPNDPYKRFSTVSVGIFLFKGYSLQDPSSKETSITKHRKLVYILAVLSF